MQSQSPTPSRKELEQELTAFALHIGEKSDRDAAATLLELYQKFKLAEMESEMRKQLERVEENMHAALESQLTAQTAENETPKVSAEEEQANPLASPEPIQLEIPSASEEHELDLSPEVPAESEDLEALKLVVKESLTEEAIPQKEIKTRDAEAGIEHTDTLPLDEAPLPQKESPVSEEKATLSESGQQSGTSKSLNDRFAQKVLKFGLNDRIGFVKALFEGNQEDFNRVVSQLNTLSSLDEATAFIETYVAPEYKWDQQEEMAERFMTAVSTKFN
ncbi:MAG: Uncharacterised protein [Flavobacteriales bacterium UBA4585]|nr:MAG: Uncharacterised protein [Flavobacteriales bacterium UBA4585]